jgi:hypothetical protein
MPIDPDPHWFYSTLAQASAAIVGILLAALTGRMNTHRSEIEARRKTLRTRLRSIKSDIEQRVARATSTTKQLELEIAKDDATLAEGKEERETRRSFDWLGMHLLKSPRTMPVYDHRSMLASHAELIRKTSVNYPALQGHIDASFCRRVASGLKKVATEIDEDPSGLRRPAQAELLADAENLSAVADDLDEYQMQLVPRAFAVAIGLFVLLTSAGVIWPLSKLEGYDIARDWMFVAVTLGVTFFTVTIISEIYSFRKRG